MSVDADDALRRYGHVRGELAAVDARFEAIDVKAHTAGHGAPLSPDGIAEACDLLAGLAEHSRAFADAADSLADSLREST